MEQDEIERLFSLQLEPRPIQTLEEWQQLLPAMYAALVRRAETVPYDQLPIGYVELGGNSVYLMFPTTCGGR